MKDFYQRLEHELATGPVAMATVVSATGSTPRQVGARMGYHSDGRTWGTVGGGAAEGKVLASAAEVMSEGASQRILIDLNGVPTDIREGVCGGRMEVWVQKLLPEQHRASVGAIVRQMRVGAEACIAQGFEPTTLRLRGPKGGSSEFIETVDGCALALVVGAGHIGVSLSRLLIATGFEVLLHDDREGLLREADVPATVRRASGPLGRTLSALGWQGPVFLAIVSRGMPQDVVALKALADVPLKYAGLLGSRRRIGAVKTALGTDISRDCWETVRAPIGVSIAAETPEEIAVSIVAEMIACRRGAEV